VGSPAGQAAAAVVLAGLAGRTFARCYAYTDEEKALAGYRGQKRRWWDRSQQPRHFLIANAGNEEARGQFERTLKLRPSTPARSPISATSKS